jgi:hypothetical protein
MFSLVRFRYEIILGITICKSATCAGKFLFFKIFNKMSSVCSYQTQYLYSVVQVFSTSQ